MGQITTSIRYPELYRESSRNIRSILKLTKLKELGIKMGTVEKIVDTLNKMCLDKKSQATHRYEEHSDWLAHEFKTLRNLIQVQNPQTSVPCEYYESKQKRKSPETCSDGFRNSPLAKRNSSDFADIASAEGLPADLTRLKKEELLAELESRGNCTMTMKALKKDLVDALKDLLLDMNARQCNEPLPSTHDDNISEANPIEVEDKRTLEATDSAHDSIPTVEMTNVSDDVGGDIPSPQVRKVSTLAEARQQINEARQSFLHEKQESSSDRSHRLTQEYEARKMRHRMSQARLSQAIVPGNEMQGQSTSTSEPVKEDAVTEQEENGMPNERSVSLESGEEDEDSVWNEVPSPPREAFVKDESVVPPAPPTTSVSELTTGHEPKNLITSMPRSSSKHAQGKEHVNTVSDGESAPVPIRETNDARGPVSITKNDSSDSIPDDQKPVSNTASAGVTNVKKLGNLIGGTQTSFLSGSSTSSIKDKSEQNKTKTVVPALQLAMKQKEREEARAAQKKKDLEEKKKEYMRKMQQASKASAQSTSTSKLFSSKLTSSKPTEPNTVSQPTQKKAGFGWFGKKEAAPVATAAQSLEKVEKVDSANPVPLKTDTVKHFEDKVPASADAEEPEKDQENMKSTDSSAPPGPPDSAPGSNLRVLSEKQVNPTEYKQSAVEAVGAPSAAVKQDGNIECSPPREEYPISTM